MNRFVVNRLIHALMLTALVAAAGCGTHSKGPIPPGEYWEPDGGSSGGDAKAPTDDASSIDPGTGPDKPCSEMKFVPQKVGDPDIILIQDRSGSMSDGMPTKYDQMVGAVGSVITQLEAAMSPIQWGLIMFPSDNDCGVSANPPVTVGPKQGAKVVATVKANSPGGSTPLSKAVDVASAYYDTVKDGRGHYLLVATDGEPNCDNGQALPKTCTKNADCPMGQICQVLGPFGFCIDMGGNSGSVKSVQAARAKGIKTFIVGISLNGISTTMNALADAGGTARAGQTKYYPVSDQAQLETALKTITGQIISCSFVVQSLPMDNQEILVTVDGNMVAQDKTHMNGWDFDAMTKTLTFYGTACTTLQAKPGTVSVGYTCPPPG